MRFSIGLPLCCLVALRTLAQAPPQSADIVGPHDLLCIGIWDTKLTGGETLKTVRVDPQGKVSLFVVGEIKLAGLNFEQAEAAINVAYRNNGVLENASASLNRLETGNAPAIQSAPIAPGDRISVRMLDLVPEVEQDRILTVTPGGKVGLPLLGQFRVAGMTESAAEQAISRAIADRFEVRNVKLSVLRLGTKQDDEPTVASPPPTRGLQDQPRAKR